MKMCKYNFDRVLQVIVMTAQVWEWDGKWTEASSTPFVCNLFTSQYDRNVSIDTLGNIFISFPFLQICILICLVLPAIICLYILRMSSNPSQYILLVVVCESNIIFWSSVIYLIVTHSCSGSRGKELVVPALISTFFINIPAALYNDHFFPDAKMTLREAKVSQTLYHYRNLINKYFLGFFLSNQKCKTCYQAAGRF